MKPFIIIAFLGSLALSIVAPLFAHEVAPAVKGFNKVDHRSTYSKYLLPIASVSLNVPYLVYVSFAENRSTMLYNHFLYKGMVSDISVNYALIVLNMVSLFPDLSLWDTIFLNGMFWGVQATLYCLTNACGVSMVWSSLAGVALGKICLNKPSCTLRLLIPLMCSAGALVYYALVSPPLTTVAHLSGIALGFVCSIPLFKGKYAHRHDTSIE